MPVDHQIDVDDDDEMLRCVTLLETGDIIPNEKKRTSKPKEQ